LSEGEVIRISEATGSRKRPNRTVVEDTVLHSHRRENLKSYVVEEFGDVSSADENR
jgi:hypothetical protein